jgi:hypothetical protein
MNPIKLALKTALDTRVCEFCDCLEEATVYNESLEAWLCEKHEDGRENHTGYCNQSCLLGYGCDGCC